MIAVRKRLPVMREILPDGNLFLYPLTNVFCILCLMATIIFHRRFLYSQQKKVNL